MPNGATPQLPQERREAPNVGPILNGVFLRRDRIRPVDLRGKSVGGAHVPVCERGHPKSQGVRSDIWSLSWSVAHAVLVGEVVEPGFHVVLEHELSRLEACCKLLGVASSDDRCGNRLIG